MKKILFIALGAIYLMPMNITTANTEISVEQSQDYKDGWEDGYCEGWKDVKGQYACCPYAPYAPYPEYGQDTYRGGYNRGFKAGTRAAYKSN